MNNSNNNERSKEEDNQSNNNNNNNINISTNTPTAIMQNPHHKGTTPNSRPNRPASRSPPHEKYVYRDFANVNNPSRLLLANGNNGEIDARASNSGDDTGSTRMNLYHDAGSLPPQSMQSQKLPSKLSAMLSDPDLASLITWMPHGRSWKVLKRDMFTNIALPKYFGHSNFASFVRIVNAWGFHRVSLGVDRDSYYHELFLRGKPQLHLLMKRLTSCHKKTPVPKGDDSCPDFYELAKTSPLPESPALSGIGGCGGGDIVGSPFNAVAAAFPSSQHNQGGTGGMFSSTSPGVTLQVNNVMSNNMNSMMSSMNGNANMLPMVPSSNPGIVPANNAASDPQLSLYMQQLEQENENLRLRLRLLECQEQARQLEFEQQQTQQEQQVQHHQQQQQGNSSIGNASTAATTMLPSTSVTDNQVIAANNNNVTINNNNLSSCMNNMSDATTHDGSSSQGTSYAHPAFNHRVSSTSSANPGDKSSSDNNNNRRRSSFTFDQLENGLAMVQNAYGGSSSSSNNNNNGTQGGYNHNNGDNNYIMGGTNMSSGNMSNLGASITSSEGGGNNMNNNMNATNINPMASFFESYGYNSNNNNNNGTSNNAMGMNNMGMNNTSNSGAGNNNATTSNNNNTNPMASLFDLAGGSSNGGNNGDSFMNNNDGSGMM